MPRTPLAQHPARRIALIKPSALGDIVHSLPVLTAVRRRYPEAHIAWVVNRGHESLQGCPRPWLVFGVGSRWPTKRWPPQHFAELARRAQARFGGTVLFIGGGDECDLSRQTAALLTGPARDLTGATSLPQLAALLAR